MAEYTAFDLTYRVARILGCLVEGTTTAASGNQTTLTDAVYLQNVYPDDYFNGGQVWHWSTTDPFYFKARVTDFVSSTGVLTFQTLGVNPANNSHYAVSTNQYPYYQILSAISAALLEVQVPIIDTSLSTAANKLEYTLPATIINDNFEVWLQGYTSDTDANEWYQVHDWYVSPALAAEERKLTFRSQPTTGLTIRLIYYLPHSNTHETTLVGPTEFIQGTELFGEIDVNRVCLDAAYRLLVWRQQQTAEADPELARKIAEMLARAERAKWRAPNRHAWRKLATLGDVG